MAQPPSSKLSLKGLLLLPYRLCNPPPAVGKVRSCTVTPVLDVRLDDVLARKHLPPIGLKDFEEFLLYVEHAPENLYFILWLKEYTARYNAWAQREKATQSHLKEKVASKRHSTRQMFRVPPTPDPSLAMFYARAKQTFFTPNAEYELNIPSDVLAPFHCTSHNAALHSRSQLPLSPWHSQSVHPDPAVFTEVAIEARNMLNESLTRFVRLSFPNVGSRRAACGIIAGTVCVLVAGVLPLVLTTGSWNVGPHGRFVRLIAFPGMWLGLTVLIASLQGICLMVYIFGDLRQLRNFELARPVISRPIPMPVSPPMFQVPSRTPLVTGPTTLEKKVGEEKTIAPSSPTMPTPPSRAATRSHPPFTHTTTQCEPSEASSEAGDDESSCESCESGSCYSVSCHEIDVSPAFFDEVPAPEGPATASCLYRPEYRASVVQSQSQQQQQQRAQVVAASLTSPEPAYVRTNLNPQAVKLPTPVPVPVPISIPTPGSFGHGNVDPGQSSRSTVGTSKNHSVREYRSSAGFIPHDYSSDGSGSGSTPSGTLRSRSGTNSFDFDLLPETQKAGGPSITVWRREDVSCGVGWAPPIPIPTMNSSSQLPPPPPPPTSFTSIGPLPLFGRAQYKCTKQTYGSTYAFSASPSTSPVSSPSPTSSSFTMVVSSLRSGVPAFASPLTQVRSEVVKRAQWEVVIKAGLMAFVGAGVVVGVVVGVVP